jgi:hypothetical protein
MKKISEGISKILTPAQKTTPANNSGKNGANAKIDGAKHRVNSGSAQLGKSLSTTPSGRWTNAAQLMKSGQHDRTPVTTKHEKSFYANPLFAVSYDSFQGRP